SLRCEENVGVASDRNAGKVIVVPVVRHKPEQLVLDQRATYTEASHLALVGGLQWLRGESAGSSLHVDLREFVKSAEVIVAIVEVAFPLNSIGPALGHGINHATCRASILRRVIRCVDLKFLHSFFWRGVSNARTSAFFGEERLIVVGSVYS